MDTKRFFVYVRSHPRAVALVPTQALSDPEGTFVAISALRADNSNGNGADSNGDIQITIDIERVEKSLRYYSPLDIDAVYGCAGVLDYQGDTYVFIITQAQFLCNIADLDINAESKPIFRVTQVMSLSLTDNIYDSQAYRRMPGAMYDDIGPVDMDVYGISNPCTQMCAFLANGAFYFSPHFDITRSLQSQKMRTISADDPDIYDPDPKFQWNNSLLLVFNDYRMHMCNTSERQLFDNAGYAVSLIQGAVEPYFAGRYSNGIESHPDKAVMAVFLISRSSSMRSGMRFLTRGVDDEGGVANEVETEIIVVTKAITFSHVQIRGSIPVFWTQEGFQIGSHRVHITRSVKATLPATKRHFSDLLSRYKRVCAVNLLKQHNNAQYDYTGSASTNSSMVAAAANGAGYSEADLGRFYKSMIDAMGLPRSLVAYEAFDYNGEIRGGHFDRVNALVRQLNPLLSSFQYFMVSNESGTVLSVQRGIQRTNCIDCLDRTNVVQSVISRAVIGEFMRQSHIVSNETMSAALDGLGRLWASNGNSISRLYTGTGALKSDVTTSGKSGWAGFFSDASKSLSRLMQNNFQDKGKQSTIDLLLGSGDSGLVCRPVRLYDPYESVVATQLERELLKISRRDMIHVMLCTYNMHGKPYSGEPLESWLAMPQDMRPDFVAIGFQEIVNLDVQSVIAADNSNRRVWEQALSAEINKQYRKAFAERADGEYALVSSEQLVGVALLLFAHESLLPRLHNVQMVKYKTGLAGMAGNKGCVAAHMMLDDTSICIVVAHLAAGQSNVAERNSDFHTIRTGTRFRRGMHIDDHDYAFWLGDLNYRIDLPSDQARKLVSAKQVQSLMMYDQLSLQMASGKVFRGYSEAEIHFAPTYKFDTGTDIYDTSEKMRVPSWTDRIMYRGKDVHVLSYYRDEIRLSDHKPVLAIMKFEVLSIDKALKRQITRNLYAQRHNDQAVLTKSKASNGSKIENLIDWAESPSRERPDIDLTRESDTVTPANPHIAVKGSNIPDYLPPSSDTQAWWDIGGPVEQLVDNVKSTKPVYINPFASRISAIESYAVSPVNSIRSRSGSQSRSQSQIWIEDIKEPQKQLQSQPQLIDVSEDPFADDGSGISWEPIQPH
ncbi:Inositol-1,4,5-trisphosphate 5-phosphatase 1 [Coemansia erecta]|uniref:phosphoinositide 5-phosphatase n=1 Tax=Coemansia asiatica TaxID=1052880 RepID=A0A9W8CN68_9FUNG|nr:Inositol-1,4,5-trisphosphate 5-phosphatase 1 [Coemansia asiatica]KAJ2857823.1 Inositol-1,4,5-trisphosphate 5-phosphatase 1 [Coemansia erecta]